MIESQEVWQITPRTAAGGGSKGCGGKGYDNLGRNPYALILKPIRGKGNVVVYLRTGLVIVGCAEHLQPHFLKMIEAWTTYQPS